MPPGLGGSAPGSAAEAPGAAGLDALSDAEFEQRLGCNRRHFAGLAPWKQRQLLRLLERVAAESSDRHEREASADDGRGDDEDDLVPETEPCGLTPVELAAATARYSTPQELRALLGNRHDV